jgi:hypothetical protein
MSESSLFCCGSIEPYRPAYLQHQSKFTKFMAWAAYPKTCIDGEKDKVDLDDLKPQFVIQLVRQVNYGAIEWKKFFAATPSQDGTSHDFVEVSEADLIRANFQKLNSSVLLPNPPIMVKCHATSANTLYLQI